MVPGLMETGRKTNRLRATASSRAPERELERIAEGRRRRMSLFSVLIPRHRTSPASANKCSRPHSGVIKALQLVFRNALQRLFALQRTLHLGRQSYHQSCDPILFCGVKFWTPVDCRYCLRRSWYCRSPITASALSGCPRLSSRVRYGAVPSCPGCPSGFCREHRPAGRRRRFQTIASCVAADIVLILRLPNIEAPLL